jgi:CMP/dCMP kinase
VAGKCFKKYTDKAFSEEKTANGFFTANYPEFYFSFFSDFCFMPSSKKIIITIDGWSSCGKSTLAKQLAKELGYIYIDSGAMYRAITLYFLRNHIDWTKHRAVENALSEIFIEFIYNSKNELETHLNGENVEYVIRDLVVAEKVSEVAAIKEVREFAVMRQQEMGKAKGIVMDGRDIGTVVFPDAELKIFMTADNSIRVERRFNELYAKNPNITLEEVRNNLEMRDYIDSNREISPLKQAKDAIVLDNTNITEKQQLEMALGWVKERQANPPALRATPFFKGGELPK